MKKKNGKQAVSRVGSKASPYRYVGRIHTNGYCWKYREPGKSAKFEGTILEEEFGGDYLLSNDEQSEIYTLELVGEKVWRKTSTKNRERCYPVFDLVNTLINTQKQKDNAITIVEKYGLPNNCREIGLEEFYRFARKYDEFFTKLSRGVISTFTTSPPPRYSKVFEADGTSWNKVENFNSFCLLQAQALYELRREVRRCKFCSRWYALERASGAGRGAAATDRLRFCPYAGCRQKSHASSL